MASLLFALGVLSYDQIKKAKTKHTAKKALFSEQEKENAARINALQETTCFCQRSDWQGGGCEVHGYVPAAGEVGGPPAYMEVDSAAGVGDRRGEEAPAYVDGDVSPLSERGSGLGAPPPMGEEEVRRINEERRRKGKGGGLGGWRLKRKGNKEEGVVR